MSDLAQVLDSLRRGPVKSQERIPVAPPRPQPMFGLADELQEGQYDETAPGGVKGRVKAAQKADRRIVPEATDAMPIYGNYEGPAAPIPTVRTSKPDPLALLSELISGKGVVR